MKTFQRLTLTLLATLTLMTQSNAATELTINPEVDATVSSDLSVTTLHKTGINKLTLTGSNSIEILDIQAGTVSVGAVGAIHATPAAVSFTTADGGKLAVTGTTGVINANVTANSGIFDIATGTTTTLSSLTGGAGKTLDKQGAGTLTVDGVADNSAIAAGIQVTAGTLQASGNNSLTTLTTLSGGTLALADTVTTARSIVMAADSSVSVASGESATLGGAAAVLTGGRTLTKTGAGTLALSGDKSTATTAFKVDAGILSIDTPLQLPVGQDTPTLTLNGGQLTVGAAIALPLAISVTEDSTIDTTGAVTQANAITGSASKKLTKQGTGSLAVTTDISALPEIAVTAGSLIAAAANQLPVKTTLNGGILQLADGVTTAREIAVGASNGSVSVSAAETATLGGAAALLTGGNRVTKTGNGTLVLTGDKSTATTGFTVSAGTLRAGAANVFPAGGSPALTLANNSTLDITGAYTLPVPIALSDGATATLSINGNDVTHSAALTGSGTLAKTGAGILTLNAAATRAASATAITVSAGTLSVGATTDLPGAGGGTGLTLAPGTTLATTGAVTPPRAIALAGNATLSAGATTTISNGLSGAFILTKSGAGDLVVSSDISAVTGITVSDASTYIAQAATALPATVTLANGATLSLTTGGTVNAAPVTNAVSVGGGSTATLSGTATGFNAAGQLHTISKTGAGTLALTGDKSASTSVISVTAGVLSVADATNFPAAVTVASGSTLTTTGAVTSFGDGAVGDTRTLNMASGSTLVLGGNWDKAITVGSAT